MTGASARRPVGRGAILVCEYLTCVRWNANTVERGVKSGRPPPTIKPPHIWPCNGVRGVVPAMALPAVRFTDERLPNGLRLVMSDDHLAPVVAVNVWYDVGSKHEVPGKTGFAHLFEHVMFQGSAHVRMADRAAASWEDSRESSRPYSAPTTSAFASAGTSEPGRARDWVERYFGGIPATPSIPRLGTLSRPAVIGKERREVVPDRVPLP